MRKILLITSVMLFFLAITTQTFAQGGFYVSGALSLPTGDFAEDDGSGAGMAETGYGGLVEYSKPVISSGVYWVTSVSYLINPVDENGIAKEVFGDINMADHIEANNYNNIPIATGLKYQTDLETVKAYGLFQVGLNINMIGEWTMTDVYYEGLPVDEIIFEFETSNSFGFIIGGGIIISERFNISARYYGLGETEVDEASVTVDGDQMDWSDAVGEEFEISMFVITAGINF
jgi:hypothetical protein